MSTRDKDYYNMTISISKALNLLEAPLKTKHARAAIICTHKNHGAQSFWAVILRQPLMENRFTAWKFCHLLHKVLREGHPKCISDSQRHRKMMLEVGKLWGHLNDGFGICVQFYTKMLVHKLSFHERNPRIPGNLIISFTELERVYGNDINFYFQLGVEIFDYVEEILGLQAKIFLSINAFHTGMTSMTPQGQCRLAPLIPLIQDSNQLYDFAVRLMFKLHSNLPNDILSGHRNRFRTMFSQLKTFYNNVRPLQYFADLIQVPQLPETAPNFSSKVDFGSYIPPVVVVPEPEPDPIVDNLIDMSLPKNNINADQIITSDHAAAGIDFERLLQERDNLIRELQDEIEHLNKCVKMMSTKNREEINELEQQILRLNSELADSKEEIIQMRVEKDEYELRAQTAPTLEQKAMDEKKRAIASEEKFNKLKSMYSQIRDEHVNLLRQHGEISKQLSSIKKESNELITEKELIKVQLEEYQQKEYKNETLREELSKAAQLEVKVHEKYSKLNDNYEQLQFNYDNLQADKSAEIAELRIKIDCLHDEILSKKVEHQNELDKLNIELNSGNNKLVQIKESNNILMLQKNSEIETLKNQNKLNEEKYKYELDEKYQKNLKTIAALELSLKDSKVHGLTNLHNLLKSCIHSSKDVALWATNEHEITQSTGISEYFFIIAEELQDKLSELNIGYEKYSNDTNQVEELAKKTIFASHLIATIQYTGMTICNTSSDIECGERIAEELKTFGKDVIDLFNILQHVPNLGNVKSKIHKLKEYLTNISSMIHQLKSKSDNSAGQICDQIESELASMDKAIEEAAAKIINMLSKSRASDSGVKLEVNEKILDSCTNLMECIRVLVHKSRLLQAEIVDIRKGSASAKEFYKRNHQWTEGLISAAKSVAQGANLLVSAANKAVSGETKHNLDLIVAAQEIAACTAQLVVASRVKAPRDSENLNALSIASKNVTQATGKVVATAKDCRQQLEDLEDLDFSKLTVHQAKTLEMEIQVKVLELEQSLQMERLRLAAFRKKNYQNSE